MADSNGIDVLMKVVATAGSAAMSSESRTAFSPVAPSDQLLSDFTAGHFCELRGFDFSAGVGKLIKKDDGKDDKKGGKKKDAKAEKQTESSSSSGSGNSELDRKLSLYRNRLERIDKREQGDFVDMQPVGYSRIMDSSSTLLFKALTECTTLASITIVKRKAAGVANAGLGYLRLDFEHVLMTELKWKDSEHIMVENGTFIYRKLLIQYRPQKANGTLDVVVPGKWEMQAQRTGT